MKPIYKQIEDYLNYCQNVRLMTESSIRCKTTVLKNFAIITECDDLRRLTNETINKYIEAQASNGVSPHTINDYITKVVAMVRYYKEMGMNVPLKIPLVPKLKEIQTRRVYYDKAQIEEVLEHTDDISGLMIRIAFDTGMRINELTNLKISDFNERKVCFIGKGRIWHESYISQKTYEYLQEYIKNYNVKTYLWEEPNQNKPISSVAVTNRMRKPFFECGHTDFHPHALRHSFATDLQKQGATVEEIQHMIGHSSASITERYLHGFEGMKMKELFDKYH